MARERILVIEDEEDILEVIVYNLAKNGFQVTCVTSGEKALAEIESHLPDVVVIDWMLPGISGIEICQKIKEDSKLEHLPVIMLTAKGEESDILHGLQKGADDYITKPFSSKILVARVKALLRRKVANLSTHQSAPIHVHDLMIHPGKHEVSLNHQIIHLTYTEFQILYFLARHPGWVFTRSQIVDGVRGEDYAVTDRSVDVQIVGLRKKLESAGNYIETVRGLGYRFKE